jgi:phospholipid/cholesterol/gamma-HCH transport system permease protein
MLVGLILASVGTLGTIQLKMFGSQIFVADAVTIGMLRVMDAIMTGRFMVGRYQNRFAKK